MTFLSLPAIGSMTFDITNFLGAHPSLIHEIGGHALAHVFYSHLRHRPKRRAGFSRRQTRKLVNAKRRWFVDNIIMHHKRLHDRNREIIVSNVRSKILAKREIRKEKPGLLKNQSLHKDHNESTKWRQMVEIKRRGVAVRGRIDARRLRARSRWLTIVESIKT